MATDWLEVQKAYAIKRFTVGLGGWSKEVEIKGLCKGMVGRQSRKAFKITKCLVILQSPKAGGWENLP